MKSIYSLTYISTAENHLTEDDIVDILNKSRENNDKLNITGMLLYRNRLFIQTLEGEKEAVKTLYKKIAADPRHRSVLTMYEGYVTDRNFGEWLMGFKDLESIDPKELEGYTDFLERPYDTKSMMNTNNRASALMELFKKRR